MSRHIDYFFSCVSPWSFLGHAPFMELVRAHKVDVSYYPVSLGPVFAVSGGLPLSQRPLQRQRYRMLELQRWRVKRGVDFHLNPQFWPFDGQLADKTIIAAQQARFATDALIPRLFNGVWQRQENLAEPEVLVAIVDEVGLPGRTLVEAAAGAAATQAYEANRERAVAADMFGAPTYVLEGEVFWGQDRVELLGDALATGRAPFSTNPTA